MTTCGINTPLSAGGSVTINGDSGSLTGSTVTIKAGISTQNCGSSVEFVNTGTTSTLNVTDASANTLIGLTSGNATLSGTTNNSLGSLSLKSLTTGSSNNAVGYQALTSVTSGGFNTAVGQQALQSVVSNSHNSAFGYGVLQNCTGSNNTAIGDQSLKNITSGSYNCALGNVAGNSLATTDTSNINIMNNGTAGDNNTIRIGTQGTGNGQQNSCFIAGITGATVTGSTVLCSTSGQLGTIPSSERFKEQIQPISVDNGFINLRPVKFKYKGQKDNDTHYGLIAEEVEKIFPDLVLYDDEKKPASVKYHEMPALLLDEIQKLRSELREIKENMKNFICKNNS